MSWLSKGLGKVGRVASFAAPLAASLIPGVGPVAGAALGAATGGGRWGGLKKIGSAALQNPDLLLAGGSMLMGARQQGRANKAADRALAMREQAWNDFAPIRKLGIERMQNTQRPDLSAIYRNDQNPFA